MQSQYYNYHLFVFFSLINLLLSPSYLRIISAPQLTLTFAAEAASWCAFIIYRPCTTHYLCRAKVALGTNEVGSFYFAKSEAICKILFAMNCNKRSEICKNCKNKDRFVQIASFCKNIVKILQSLQKRFAKILQKLIFQYLFQLFLPINFCNIFTTFLQ